MSCHNNDGHSYSYRSLLLRIQWQHHIPGHHEMLSLNYQSTCATTRLPYVPCPLLDNKGAHIINGNIAPDSPSTTQKETIHDIHNTSVSETSDDFDCFKKENYILFI